MVLTGVHDPWLVALSILIATLASYTALDLASRIKSASRWGRRAWLFGAAVAMGGGIWSMHFVAMLAFSLGIPSAYDVGLTLFSFITPIVVTAGAFLVVSRASSDWGPVVLSGCVMGAGIVVMHYSGMAAMRMPADLTYDNLLVAASALVAVGASTVALWVAFRTETMPQRLAAAMLMGAAISGMHYTGMAAAQFTPNDAGWNSASVGLEQTRLALAVSVITFVILFLALVAAMFDRRFAFLAEREAAALRQSEERFRELYNRTPIALHSVNAEARLIDVNDQWLELFGYGRDEVIGRYPAEFMTEASAQQFWDRYWPELAQARTRFMAEYQFVKRSGEVFEGRVGARAEFDAAGRFARSWAVISDVTTEKRAEEQLRQAQKMEAVGQLTGGVAHDFNNLLTVVLGNVERIEQGTDDPRLKRLAAAARQAGDRAAALTSKLLAFSRKQPLHPERVNISARIEALVPLLRNAIRPVTDLSIRSKPTVWPSLVDPQQLEAVLLNLAINARDAMPEGGRIEISLANKTISADEAELELAPGDYVCITVRDTGTGIAPENIDRVFDPFFTTKAPGKGSGLGLAQVYGFAKQSGGGVRVESELGRGAAFHVYLPRAPEPGAFA